jgi:hypothetical protein
MRFRPRHYALIAVILALGMYNLVRRHRMQKPASAPTIVSRGTSPTWPIYDNAAKLRDASGEQFEPALKAVAESINSNATASTPLTSAAETTDLRGCQTWLLFYRQEHLRPSNRPGWLAQTQRHVDSCVANHRDIAQ